MIRRCRPLLGTFVEVTAQSSGHIDAAFAAVERVHALMSAHDPVSELSRINRHAHREPLEVSDETAEVLDLALHWRRLSGGVFDVVAAGKRSLAEGRIPRHPGQPLPRASSSRVLTVEGRTVRLTAPACIDLGGIAKGYAVDQAVAAMRRLGAGRGLVNAGGDMFGFGPQAWMVAVIDPTTRQPTVEVALRDDALATSACLDGSRAHLPGDSIWSSVTVRANSACEADLLTKIVWAAPRNVGDLLDRANARAFGIRADGRLEDVARLALAA